MGLALAAALLFAVTVNTAPLAYAAGASVLMLMSIRFGFTAVASSSLRRGKWLNNSITRRDAVLLLFASLMLAGQSFGYMAAVNFLPVSIAVILFYTFPILTFVISSVVNGRSFKIAPFIALGITLVGIYLLVQDGSHTWHMIGIFWAFFAAIMQAIINIISPKIAAVSGWEMVRYTSLLPAMAFLSAYLLNRESFSLGAMGWSLAAASTFCLGLYLFYRSISIIGPVRTANLLYFEPLFSVSLGLLVFGERLKQAQWLGAILIILATLALEIQERTQSTKKSHVY
ncbi:MAG: DMT family transporter [Anaerolineae bacterium]